MGWGVTVLEVIQRSAEFLSRKGVESPRLQVELLLAEVLRLPRLQLYLNFARELSEPELQTLREYVRRRGQREPLQHIVGSAGFCGLTVRVNRQVLVPRPETERLAELGWTFLNQPGRMNGTPPRALDIGTGSGCLALALAAKSPSARVTALDVSEEALAVARDNARQRHLEERIEFVRSDRLAGLAAEARYDLIVSNPPYIPTDEIATLEPEVRDFDPRPALDGGADGLTFYRWLAVEAAARLRAGGRLMLEFGDGQAPAVTEILRGHGWTIEAVEADLAGRDRIVIACRPDP